MIVISNKLAGTVGTVGTVALADPVTEPTVACTEALPKPIPFAKPLTFTEMMDELLELQVAEEVRSCVLLSANVPVAVNCSVSLN